jgi:hypothetical protein
MAVAVYSRLSLTAFSMRSCETLHVIRNFAKRKKKKYAPSFVNHPADQQMRNQSKGQKEAMKLHRKSKDSDADDDQQDQCSTAVPQQLPRPSNQELLAARFLKLSRTL